MSGAGLAPVFPDDALLNSQEPHDQWTARMPLDDISDEVVFSNESQRKEIPEEAQTHKRLAIQPIPARSQPEMRSEAIDTIETSDLSWAQCSERPCSQPTSVFSTIFDSDETERRKVMLIRDAFLIARTSHCVGIAFEIFTRLQGALGDSQKRIAFASLNSMLGCHPSALVAALTPDTVPLLVSLPDYDDWAIDLLAKFLQYRAEYLPTSCDQVGSNETASVLAVCCARSGISDPKNLGPSGLRSGLVSIWSRLPTTRDQSPPLLDLLLHWINDSGAALKTKGELFTLLFHQADRLQGGDGWLLSGFLELVSRSRAHCARDLQLVMSFFSFEACVRVLYLLFGLPTWCPRRVMGTWLLLVVYAWEPTKPPRMAPFLQETGIPLYRLLSAYLKCLWEFKPPESSLMKEYLTFFYVPGSEISTELSTLDAAKRLHYLQGAMTETAIRLVLAKCSSPLNTLDGCQLFMYLLDSGPFPLGQCPSTPHLLRSTLQFMRGIEFRLTTPLKAKPKVVSAMRDVIGRIDAVVGGPSDNTRRYSNQLNPFHPDRLSEERETNCEPKTNVSTRQLVSTRALSMVVPSVPSHPPSKILPILIAERNLRHIPVVPSAVKTEGGLPPQPSDFDDPFAFPPNFYGPIAPLIRPVTEPALPVTSTPSGLVNDGNTCYLNAVLQCLFLTDLFRGKIFRLRAQRQSHKLAKAMQRTMAALVCNRGTVDPSELRDALPPRFQTGDQMDASEACNAILDGLGGLKNEAVGEAFVGETVSAVVCRNCQYSSETRSPVTDFQLALPGSGHVGMQDLFGQFQETTDADDYRCDKCGFKGTATKSTLISSPPAHIFAVMTRYAYDVDSAALIKLMTRVSLSPVLVVSGWLYDMYAVVVHAGKNAGSGHYYAIGRRSEDPSGPWYRFDDAKVTLCPQPLVDIEEGSGRNETPFCVFYRCQQAPSSPPPSISRSLLREARSLMA